MVVATGAPATVSFEKMSKSKYNGVDPTGFIAQYGADATRAHMLFQAPVGDVLNWDEAKIAGVTRWLHKLHDQIVEVAKTPESVAPVKEYLTAQSAQVKTMDKAQLAAWDAEAGLWREAQRTIDSVRASYDEIYSLNTVVSDLMTLTNTLVGARKAGPVIRRETASIIIRLVAPITPAFAEECWRMLHPSAGSIFDSGGFPASDDTVDLVKARQQSCAVQVNGKVRGVVTIPPPPAHLEGDALRDWMVSEILKTEEGKSKFSQGAYSLDKAKKVIAVPGGKVINFVL
jgi:leucyl-tRNA synthetase